MVPTTSLFRFQVLDIVLASTFILVFLLESLGLSCPCVPEDVANSPLLSPADVMSSVRPPLSSVLGAVSSSLPLTKVLRQSKSISVSLAISDT